MKRKRVAVLTSLTSATALALVLAGTAFGAQPTAPPAGGQGAPQVVPGQHQPAGATAQPEHGAAQQPSSATLGMATDVVGMPIRNAQGDKLGTISNVIVTPDGKVKAVVLEHGGMLGIGSAKYNVPWSKVQLAPDSTQAVVDVNKDELKSEFSAFESIREQNEAQKADQRAEEHRTQTGGGAQPGGPMSPGGGSRQLQQQ